MKYKIPENKVELEQEQRNMVLSAPDREAARIQKALSFVADYAGSKEKYQASPQNAYRALHRIYTELQLGEDASLDVMFPEGDRSAEHFRAELEKLWRVMELQSLLNEQEPEQSKKVTLAETWKKYQRDPEQYDRQLREKEAEEPELPLQHSNRNLLFTPIDPKSPYYEYVSGTAYMELQESWQALEKKSSVPGFEQDMESLLAAMQLHYVRRSSTGTMLPMTGEEYKEIRSLYRNCMDDLRKFSKREKERPEYQALRSLIARNRKELDNLSADDLPPLGDVLHGAKDPVIHLQEGASHTVGRSMSSRETVEYIDENGKLRQGLFTPEKKLARWDQESKELLDRFIRTYPKYEGYFKRIRKDQDVYDRIERAAQNDRIYGNGRYLRSELKSIRWIKPEDKKSPEFTKIFLELGAGIERIRNIHTVLSEAGIQVGDNLAKRSSAMSDVAGALGFPELLVKSRNVTVKRGDTEIPGVMMDAAGPDTVDPARLTDRHPFFNTNAAEFDRKELLSSLADLQILDYLCGNTDRHANNFFFKMDFSDPRNPKLLGVQGIDNDNSFGSLTEGNVLKLTGAENLKVVTGKMAQAIQKLKPRKLEELLQPYGFSEDQVLAAQKRLETLQGMIKKQRKKGNPKTIRENKLLNEHGTIYIAETDKDWENLSMDALIPGAVEPEPGMDEIPGNLFYLADTHRDKLKDYQADMEKDKRRKPEVAPVLNDKALKTPIHYDPHGIKEPDPKTLKNLDSLLAKESKLLRSARTLFEENGGLDQQHRTREYKTMSSALDRYIHAYEKLGTLQQTMRTQTEKKKSDEKTIADAYRSLEQARKNLDQSIQNYDKKKHILFLKEDASTRLAIARKLRQMIREKPESVKLYESITKLQDQHRKTMDEKPDSRLAAYLSEQIGSKMNLALQNNLNRLREDDPVRVQGIKALQAQKRLWDYCQNAISEGMLSVKNIEGEGEKAKRQLISMKLMQYEIRKKMIEKPDQKQIYEDIKTIQDYVEARKTKEEKRIAAIEEKLADAPRKQDDPKKLVAMQQQAGERLAKSRELGMRIEGLIQPEEKFGSKLPNLIGDSNTGSCEHDPCLNQEDKNDKLRENAEITPRQVRDLLHQLYLNELSLAKPQQPMKKKEISK